MDMLYTVLGIALVLLLVWLLIPNNDQLYRCQKCGFTTASEVEAVGHEKLENAHKVVKE